MKNTKRSLRSPAPPWSGRSIITAGSKEIEELTGQIKITTGLEFLRDVCIDTHFVYRGRSVPMAQVLVTNPACIGIGSGLVVIMDGFHITDCNIVEAAGERSRSRSKT